MKNFHSTEYKVNSRHRWVRPLNEEETETEEPSVESAPPKGLELEGYVILFDKKVALMPADLTSAPVKN